MRLELLANELTPIIAEVPDGTDLFDFAISSGLQPRFWIDAIAHVSMGRDKRTFRFLKDTRLGRVVVSESTDLKTVANAVTRYLAERIVERQRLMEGEVVEYGKPQRFEAKEVRRTPEAERRSEGGPLNAENSAIAEDTPPAQQAAVPMSQGSLKSFLSGLALAVAGAVVGLAVAAAVYWDRIGLADLIKGGS